MRRESVMDDQLFTLESGSIEDHGGHRTLVVGKEVMFSPLITDEDGRPQRTGGVWTASSHVITAVIGSGVLSLAWSMSQLGWIAGPLVLLGFSFVTYYTSMLLADTYRSPDPVTGRRNYTYTDAVTAILGGKKVLICGIIQYLNLLGTSIGYTITASISMVAIGRSDCFHEKGKESPCHISNNLYMAIFGAAQVLLSQIPNFSKIGWLSTVAAVMSLTYSFIGLGLGIGMATEKGHSHGSLGGAGISGVYKSVDKIWNVFQALGNIAFAYSFSMILIEIQDTLKSPPAENKTMKKASFIGVIVTTMFYISVGCAGYAAFGDRAPGNLLTGFGFYNPFWLVDIANICIVIHLVGAYQLQNARKFLSGKFTKNRVEEQLNQLIEPFPSPWGDYNLGQNRSLPHLVWWSSLTRACLLQNVTGFLLLFLIQVFCQPLYAFVEEWSANTWTKSCFIQNEYTLPIPGLGEFKLNLFRLVWRTCFVVFTTVVSMVLPFFNAIMGVLGAMAFFPLTVYFPIQMHITQTKLRRWSFKWVALQLMCVFCFFVTMAALVGSIAGVVEVLQHYTPFKTTY